jgi:hypothetical protein
VLLSPLYGHRVDMCLKRYLRAQFCVTTVLTVFSKHVWFLSYGRANIAACSFKNVHILFERTVPTGLLLNACR